MHLDQRLERITEVVQSRQQGVIVLEDVHDPHNAQAVFRSAEGLGFQRICLIFDQEKPYKPRSIGQHSSSSANKWLSFSIFTHIDSCAAILRDEGYELVATVPDPDAESVFEAQLLAPKLALMIGNEHRGLSPAALACADRRLTIPMAGMVQSLNLSVTAAMCLFEITRQRKAAGLERYLLDAAGRDELQEELLGR